MLKFTAQLSQQFRRASSLSTLKTYHLSRQKNHNHTIFDHHVQNHKRANTIDNQRVHQSAKTNINHYYQPKQQYIEYSRTNSECNRSKYNYLANLQMYPQKYVLNRPTCSTPQRIRYQNYHSLKNQGTKSTIPSKFYSYQQKQKNNLQEVTNQNVNDLTQLKINQISLKNYTAVKGEQKKQKKFEYESEEKQKQNTVRKLGNFNQQKINSSAKMRISSINNLQNIQRKIKATLGNQNHLKI